MLTKQLTTKHDYSPKKKTKKQKQTINPEEKNNSNTMLKCDPNITLYNVTKRNFAKKKF